MDARRVLFVVAKRPAAGQTKTRLCRSLTYEAAAQLYACFLQDTLMVMRFVPDVEPVIAYLPATVRHSSMASTQSSHEHADSFT